MITHQGLRPPFQWAGTAFASTHAPQHGQQQQQQSHQQRLVRAGSGRLLLCSTTSSFPSPPASSSSSSSSSSAGWGAAIRRHWPFVGVGDALVGSSSSGISSHGGGGSRGSAATGGARGGRVAALAAAAAATATLLTTAGGGGGGGERDAGGEPQHARPGAGAGAPWAGEAVQGGVCAGRAGRGQGHAVRAARAALRLCPPLGAFFSLFYHTD